MTTLHLTEARRWITGSFWNDQLDWHPEDLTDEDLVHGVERYYFGGWEQFRQDIETSFVAD
jgi:hypothetical protein